MQSLFARMVLAALLFAGLAPVVRGQVSIEEAERRLKAKLATRPSTTRPTTEADHLREENRRLRDEVAGLEMQVNALKEALARATPPTTNPATRPVEPDNPDGPQKVLLGRWRGGDITAGTGYLLQFDADGTYKQGFIVKNGTDVGQYRMIDESTVEMWGDKWPENKRHNRYQINATAVRVILTPLVLDGIDVKTPRAVVLRRAE